MASRGRLTISAAEAGEIVGGSSPYSGDLVRRLYREGRFPPPIDPGLPVRSWRWSRPEVERYAAGEWLPATGGRGVA